MQRVAIFRFNWGKRLVLFIILALSVLTASLFVYNTRAHADSDTTYSTETTSGIETKIKALKYYASLKWCTQSGGYNWKTTITGSDIDKGPRWWVNGDNLGGTLYIGQYIDSWGDKNGQTNCNGENDSQPGWINDMFDVFGLTLGSDKQATLKSLGYTCTTPNSGDVSCTNNNINSQTSKNGIMYQVLHGPYLNGVNPLTTQPDENAMAYFLAMNALTTNSECNASAGGSSNLVTVSEVQSDGSIKKGPWGIKNDGGSSRTVISGVPIIDDFSKGDPTCGDMANATVKYAADYASWSGESACATANPDKASDQNFLYACSQGRVNPTNYSMCITVTWNDNASINYEMKNACFIGQGLPVDANGQSSGMLCYETYRYTDTASLTACIKGSLHLSDPNYCATTYPAPDTIPGKPTPADTNAGLRAACKDGQKLQVSGGGVPQDGNLTDTTPPGTGGTSCGIDGIGWIVCPVISFMGSILADAFSGLADNFLSTDFSLYSTNSGTYIAWGVFRNFANIAFVIAFLIIIFSQLTGVGVTNYGVKKLLPRIVIAAILVNLSYFICQLAVDLSNILGYSLKGVFDGIAGQVHVKTSTDASGNGFGIAAIIIAVIATASVAYFALSILIPILLGAVIGVLMVVLMLIARKAIIILLIVLSPLAFVAFLLPNTESLFTKWRKAFMALLLLFPIISVVFGMSSLASGIILAAGPTGGDSQTVLQIIAVGVAALPFFLVPTLLKGSLNGIGTVGGKLNAFASKAGGNLGKAGGKAFQNTALARGQAARQQGRAAYRNEKFAKSVAKGGIRARFAQGANITGAQKYANAALARSAVNTAEKADHEEIQAAETLFRSQNLDPSTLLKKAGTELESAVKSGDRVKARAAQNILLNAGNKGLEQLHESLGSAYPPGSKADDEVGNSIRTALNGAGLKGKNNVLASWAFDKEHRSLSQVANDPGTLGGLNDVELAGQGGKVLAEAELKKQITVAQANAVIDNANVWKDLDPAKKAIFTRVANRPQTAQGDGPQGGSGPGGFILPNDPGASIPH